MLPNDLALKFILAVTVFASLVMVAIMVWLFANDEPQGATVMLIVLIVGYTVLGLASAMRRRRG